jgi:membrane-associated protein
MAWAESYFARYGPLTVAVARFITGLRVVAGPAAGAAGMAWGPFFMANAVGAAAWVAAGTLAGYWGGHLWDHLHFHLGPAAGAVAAVGVALVLAWHWVGWRRRPPVEKGPESTTVSGREQT